MPEGKKPLDPNTVFAARALPEFGLDTVATVLGFAFAIATVLVVGT